MTAARAITISHAELSRLIGIVAPCVGKDEPLPVFTYVHFRERAGHIEVQGTDRYTLAFARGEAKMPKGLRFNMPLRDVRHALAATKPARGFSVDLMLKVADKRAVITAASPALTSGAELRLTYAIPDGTFPNLDHVLTGWEKREATSADVAFNPEYLRRIPRFRNEPVVAVVSGRKPDGRSNPAGFFGRDWAVIIMPMRRDVGDADWPSEWLIPAAPNEAGDAA